MPSSEYREWDFADNWAEGHGTSHPFKDFDMLAEPESRWPEWLDRWYYEARPKPHPSTLATFDAAIRKVFSRERMSAQLLTGSQFVIPLKRGPSDAQPPARRPLQTGRKKNANASKGDTRQDRRASQFASPDFERDLVDRRPSAEQLGQSADFQRHACAVQSRSAHGSTAAVTLSVVRRLGCGYGVAGSPP